MQKHENVVERKAIRFSLGDTLWLFGAPAGSQFDVDTTTGAVTVSSGGVSVEYQLPVVLLLTNVVPPAGAKVGISVDPNGGGLKVVLHMQSTSVYAM